MAIKMRHSLKLGPRMVNRHGRLLAFCYLLWLKNVIQLVRSSEFLYVTKGLFSWKLGMGIDCIICVLTNKTYQIELAS